jgi:hypothetical protein
MNANELADKQAFETGELTMWVRNQTATMLRQQQAEIAELKNARDYWCLQYKDVFSKLESLKYWQDTWRPFLKEHFGVDK